MKSWWKKKVEDLSKGMQQKVQFVATVMHDPELIILDEPFSGFDPVNAEMIKDEILELNQKGATIIFSTHRMESVELLCQHIALINKSRKILDGKIKDIKNSYRNNTYRVEFKGSIQNFPGSEAIFDTINLSEEDNKTELILKLKEGKTSNDALTYLLPKAEITQLTEVIPGINEIFIEKVKSLN